MAAVPRQVSQSDADWNAQGSGRRLLPPDPVAANHLYMRPEVKAFVADGPLPGDDASEEEIDRRGSQLDAISRPLSVGEAQAMAACFGPTDLYGVAWTLIHLIETAPGPVPVVTRPDHNAPWWDHVLWNQWGHHHHDDWTRSDDF